MKLLGRTLTEEDMAKFDTWHDLRRTRVFTSKIEFLGTLAVLGLALTFPTNAYVHMGVTTVVVFMLALNLLVIGDQALRLYGRFPIRREYLLAMGNRAWDWPFGPSSRIWMSITATQAVMVSLTFYHIGWNFALAVFLITVVLDQYAIWQKAKLTQIALGWMK